MFSEGVKSMPAQAVHGANTNRGLFARARYRMAKAVGVKAVVSRSGREVVLLTRGIRIVEGVSAPVDGSGRIASVGLHQ